MTTMDRFVASRMQSIMAEHTIENVSISHWRRRHMWHLIKARGGFSKNWDTPGFVKGIRETMHEGVLQSH
jgi:hypothetical protein